MQVLPLKDLSTERAEELDLTSGKVKRELETLLLQLKETIKEQNLTGLAATQVGDNSRVFVVNFAGDLRSFINPRIISSEGFIWSRENDPSIERVYIVPRNENIVLAYQTPGGISDSNKFEGVAATVIQRLLNHLDAVTISDFGLEVTEEFDKATEQEQNEVLLMYADHLASLEKTVKEEIKNDPLLNDTYKAVEFMDSVIRGETKLEAPALVMNRQQKRAAAKQAKKLAKK